MNIKYIKKMLSPEWCFNGNIRFKFYGDFDEITKIRDDCKDELYYIGNSNKDGAPIFEYVYNNNILTNDVILDFDSLNLILRRYKINLYTKREIDKTEKSLLTFMKFFMYSCDENQIKSVIVWEIKRFETEKEDPNNYIY